MESLLVRPPEVAKSLAAAEDDSGLLIVAVGRGGPDLFPVWLPKAVFLDLSLLLRSEPPAEGLLPDASQLSQALESIGFRRQRPVLAYDLEQGLAASRLIWTLHCAGITRASLLEGGLHAWVEEGLAVQSQRRIPRPSPGLDLPDPQASSCAIDLAELKSRVLGSAPPLLIDTRSAEEYSGADVRSARGGHIPQAVSWDWRRLLEDGLGRLRAPAALCSELKALGLEDPEREIVTYCQTHHRAALTWLVLRHLGYNRVRGYAGSWSEWGNRDDTPIETLPAAGGG